MILIYPAGTLLDKAEPVTFPLSPEVLEQIKEMKTEMENAQGVGIGATQIGYKSRIFVIDKAIAGTTEHKVFINPEILDKSEQTASEQEGCLSLPGVGVSVKRHVGVKCSAIDPDGVPFSIDVVDMYARAIQHEMDHLNGKLIIHHIGSAQRSMVLNKMKNYLRNAKRQARELMSQVHRHGH